MTQAACHPVHSLPGIVEPQGEVDVHPCQLLGLLLRHLRHVQNGLSDPDFPEHLRLVGPDARQPHHLVHFGQKWAHHVVAQPVGIVLHHRQDRRPAGHSGDLPDIVPKGRLEDLDPGIVAILGKGRADLDPGGDPGEGEASRSTPSDTEFKRTCRSPRNGQTGGGGEGSRDEVPAGDGRHGWLR